MTSPNLGPDPSRTRRDESGVVAPSRVMLVAIVLVAIAAVTYVAGLGSKDESDVASAASSKEAPSATASEPSTGPSTSASTSPGASPSASTSPDAQDETQGKAQGKTQKKSQKKSRTASGGSTGGSASGSTSGSSGSGSAAPQVQRSDVDVSVFNNSSRTGLAARTSGKVKAAGWKVIGTDNWYGTIPQPTVYYPARMQQAAELLAKDVGIDRVRPAVSPMRSDRLTLIVTADYSA